MELWLATSNTGKLKEFGSLFAQYPIELHSTAELKVFSSPPETGTSFIENARIKARALKAVKSGVWVFGEDSGLVVDGLNGFPGIHSARYAGPHASDAENTAKLLKMLQLRSPANRKAHFACAIVAYSPTGQEHIFEAQMSGEISKTQMGQGGFGYDPVFIPSGGTSTLAQMDPGEKNKISHRAQAARQFLEVLRADFG